MTVQTRTRWWSKITRDLVLVTVGLGLTVREGLTSGPERPSLYILYAGMMGLGSVLRYSGGQAASGGFVMSLYWRIVLGYIAVVATLSLGVQIALR